MAAKSLHRRRPRQSLRSRTSPASLPGSSGRCPSLPTRTRSLRRRQLRRLDFSRMSVLVRPPPPPCRRSPSRRPTKKPASLLASFAVTRKRQPSRQPPRFLPRPMCSALAPASPRAPQTLRANLPRCSRQTSLRRRSLRNSQSQRPLIPVPEGRLSPFALLRMRSREGQFRRPTRARSGSRFRPHSIPRRTRLHLLRPHGMGR